MTPEPSPSVGVEATPSADLLQGLEDVLPLRRLVEGLSTGIAVTDIDGRYLWANPVYCRTVGYSQQELATLDFVTLTDPLDRPANLKLIEQLRSGQRDSFVMDKRYVTKQGTDVWVRVRGSLLHDDDGRPAQLVAATEDISAQKVAEERLAENQALLRIAGETGRVGGWAIDADRTLHWSDEMYELLGYPMGETPPLWETIDLYTPDSRELVSEAIERCFAEGAPFDLELSINTTHGQQLWAHVVGEPQYGQDGSIERIQGAFFDVSERKRAQDKVHELNERLITTLESISDAFFTLDTEWRFSYLNGRAQEVLERDACSLIGHDVWEMFPELLGTEAEEAYRRAMRTQRTEVLDEYYYPPLDAYFQVNAYPSEQGLAVYFRDVTAQRDARVALQEREARLAELAALLDEAQDSIMVRDLEGRVRFWNDSAKRIFGWTAQEARGHSVVELLGIDGEAYRRATEQLLEKGTWFGEFVKHTKDGREITVEARWTLVRDEEDAPDSVLHIDTDITERKRLEQQFLCAQRMESIGTLASGVAHDLNNALLPVVVSSDLLGDEQLSDQGRQLLVAARAGAQHGIDLVRQLLSFARGVDGRRMRVSVPDLIAEVSRISTDTFPKGITVETHIPPGISPVLGDPTQLRQVLVNLCVNARDALSEGGTITVSARNDNLEILAGSGDAAPTSGRYVTFCVEDDGPGMPPDVVSRIFDPFFTTKPQGQGTGLGLPTCAAIVQSHGGLIEVESRPGVGTTFKVHLPVDETATEPADPASREPVRGDGELVLVVDDEELVRDTTRLVLEKYGYRVLVAEGGDDALELLTREEEIAVVLTDLMMPGISGVETIQRLRRRQSDLPVVATSGAATTQTTEAALHAGASRVLLKPFTAETITAAIADALHPRSGHVRTDDRK